MIIGLLSDTHNRLAAAQAAVHALRANGAQHLLHAGDVGGEQIIDLLAGEPAAFVWGNNDFDRVGLSAYAAHLGVNCLERETGTGAVVGCQTSGLLKLAFR